MTDLYELDGRRTNMHNQSLRDQKIVDELKRKLEMLKYTNVADREQQIAIAEQQLAEAQRRLADWEIEKPILQAKITTAEREMAIHKAQESAAQIDGLIIEENDLRGEFLQAAAELANLGVKFAETHNRLGSALSVARQNHEHGLLPTAPTHRTKPLPRLFTNLLCTVAARGEAYVALAEHAGAPGMKGK